MRKQYIYIYPESLNNSKNFIIYEYNIIIIIIYHYE